MQNFKSRGHFVLLTDLIKKKGTFTFCCLHYIICLVLGRSNIEAHACPYHDTKKVSGPQAGK